MYRRVLVPLDESHVAEKAAPVGAKLAQASGGTLIFVEVVPGLAEWEAGLVPATNWAPAAVEAQRQCARAYLTQIQQREARKRCDIELATYAGAVAPTLLMAAQQHRADAIVMTTHGRTGLTRWALGSVADKLVRRASVPILLLRIDGPELLPNASASEPLRALVPLDGSLLAESALLPAINVLAALTDSQTGAGRAALHLVQVIDAFDVAPWHYPHGPESTSRQQALSHAVQTSTAYLQAVVERLQEGEAGELGMAVTWSVVFDRVGMSLEADVAESILRTAGAGEPVAGATSPSPCSLVAMATHGRGGVSRWALGSIAERVLHAGHLPMLLVGPKARQAEHETKRTG